MRSKYLILVLVTLLIVITEANSTDNNKSFLRTHAVLVGTHEVSFNASFNESFRITYSPTTPAIRGGLELDYTYAYATLWDENAPPLLSITVRDFESPVPKSAYFLEVETFDKLADYLPLRNRQSIYFMTNPMANGGLLSGTIVSSQESEYFGTLVAWPSDQIEIIITGNLPNEEIWWTFPKVSN